MAINANALYKELLSLGLSPQEAQEYVDLKEGGFSDAEIEQHFRQQSAPPAPAAAGPKVTQPGVAGKVSEAIADAAASMSGLSDRTKKLWQEVGGESWMPVAGAKSPEHYQQPSLITAEPQSALVSSASARQPERQREYNEPISPREVLRGAVRGIPSATAALAGASSLALAPVSAGYSVFTAPVAAAGGYEGGRTLRSELEKLLGFPISDEGEARELMNALSEGAMTGIGTSENLVPAVKDLVTREIPNVGKKVVGKMIGKGPQRFVSRKTGLAPTDPRVATVLEENIPLTGETAYETAVGTQREIWPTIENLLQQAEDAGQVIPRHKIEKALIDEMSAMLKQGKTPQHEDFKIMAEELQKLKNSYKAQLTPAQAQKFKQDLHQKITDFDMSLAKQEAARPRTAAQRLERNAIDEAIAETTENPELYHDVNLRYGNLAKLVEKGKPAHKTALGKADIKAAEPLGIIRGRGRAAFDKAKDVTKGAAYKAQQWAANQPEYQSGAFRQVPPGTLEEMFKLEPVTPRVKPTGEIPPKPQILEDIYAQQMQPNIPEAEAVPGTLMEGEVPRSGHFTMPEGHGQLPKQPSLVHEYAQPEVQFGDTAGTLMEGEVPTSGHFTMPEEFGKMPKQTFIYGENPPQFDLTFHEQPRKDFPFADYSGTINEGFGFGGETAAAESPTPLEQLLDMQERAAQKYGRIK